MRLLKHRRIRETVQTKSPPSNRPEWQGTAPRSLYVLANTEAPESHVVTLKAENGVRYTVPQTIDINNMRDTVTVRFRVADIYHNRSICVYYDGVKVQSRKKRVLAPGEMESVTLKKSAFADYPNLKEITICTEGE